MAEPGGQTAMIVDSSALAELVVADVRTSAFESAGERCSSLRLLYVEADIADRLLAMLTDAMAELAIGDPALIATDVGPVIDAAAREALEQHALRITEAPLAMRFRVLGIVTVCIGTGPLGVLAIGVLSDQLGPSAAIFIMAGLGVGGLGLVWRKLIEARSDGY